MNAAFLGSLICAFVSNLSGQAVSTAQISGTVKDPSGAVLPGVEVVVTQTATGARRNTITDESGSYVLTNLSIGPSMLEASLPGFRPYVQTGIVLQVNGNPVINVTLQVGDLDQKIEVQADAALVETRNSGVGAVMDNQRVLELPLNGRQVTELIFLAGAANAVTTGSSSGLNSSSRNYPTVVISVAGGQNNGLTYLLDGGTHNDPINNLNLPLPFPDALQEFKVETSALPAMYGHHSAAAVNAVTKSGTNQYHGSLFEFVRNGSLNARNAFALANDGLKRNQFGGTIGGPVVKNKLFFFGAHQTTTQRAAPSSQMQFIPTPAMLAGDFTTVASAACNNGRPVTLRAPFVDNRIDPSSFSPAALNLVKRLPTTPDPCGLIRFARRAGYDDHMTIGRMDYQRSEKHSLFGRYMETRQDVPTDFDASNILTYSNNNQFYRFYSLVLGDTYLLGTNTVASFRGTLNRMVDQKDYPPFFDLADLGVKNVYVKFPDYSLINVTNGFTIGGGLSNPGKFNTTSYQFAEDISLVRGAHQVGFGANFIHSMLNTYANIGAATNLTFSGQAATGMGLADFLLGRASSYAQAFQNVAPPRQNYIGLYLQDSWKANSRLTVNAGVRWEPFIAAYNGQPQIMRFDHAAFDRGERSTVFKNAPAGMKFIGDPGIDNKYGNNHLMHFAPRLGLVWDPEGNGQMTIRTAYGLFFDLPNLFVYSAMGGNPPWGNTIQLNNPPFDNLWQNYPGGNPFPTVVGPDVRFQTNLSSSIYPAGQKQTYAQQWNLSIQRQLGTNWLLEGTYIGSATRHIMGVKSSNPAAFMPGASCVINGVTYTPCSSTSNIDQRRQLYLQNPTEGQYYSWMIEVDDGGTSNYSGMLLSVRRRPSKGLSVQGNYTWSHCVGDELFRWTAYASDQGIYPGMRRRARQNCNSDRRQVVNLSTVYQTPRFSTSALRILASGWQVSGIVKLISGNPTFTVTSGFDTALTGSAGSDRANQVLPDPYAPNRSVNQWLNPAAFARAANGEWGNAANTIRGPGVIQIDMGLTRKFAIQERQSLEFRAEAFNLPNHLNPGNPITALNNQNFGKILTAADPRILQFALKYVF